jgi:dihydrofolate synthase/folylpolyglutamate synthase
MAEDAVPCLRSAALMQALTRNAPARIALGLSRIQALLARLDHPERRLPPVIHVAGTNGKGSVIAFLRAMLGAGGYVVHSFTSPPLHTPADQIMCAGETLDEDRFATLLAALSAVNGEAPLTAFEAETAAALLAFTQAAADMALIETGLGGRDDATNVVARPALTVLTPIARDHGELLGASLAAIAAHKAGIMKPHVPAVVGPQSEEASAVILARAQEIRAPVIRHGTEWIAYSENSRLIYQDEHGLLDLPLPALQGRHQIDNAGTAIAAIRALGGLGLDDAALSRGLTAAHWPARLQCLRQGPLIAALPQGSEIWLDGGHNPHAAAVLADFLAERARKMPMPLALVIGMRATKDADGFFKAFAALKPKLITLTIPNDERAATADALMASARQAGLAAEVASSLGDAAARLQAEGTPLRLLICGSLALAGAVLAHHA